MKSPQSVADAFGNAFSGLFSFFVKERNGKIQAAIGAAAIAGGFALKISLTEWIAVLLCTGSVLSLEMLNSALEKLCDLVNPSWHPVIKEIKDVSAAAVLWSAVVSAIIGIIIFLPRILSLL